MIDLEFLKKQFEKNFEYIVQNGYYGIEPHIYAELYFTKKATMRPTFLNKVFRKLEVKTIQHLPFLIKPYCKVLKIDYMMLTPYGLGFFLQAFSKGYKIQKTEDYLAEIEKVANQLESLLVKTKHGLGIPNSKSSNSSVLGNIVTDANTAYVPGGTECILGYLDAFGVTHEQKYLEYSKKIANSFFKDFKIKKYNNNRICFDYSNHEDNTHILNANILVALSLLEVSTRIEGTKYNEVITSSYNYTLDYIKEYDEIPYAGIEDEKINKYRKGYDCYHTGFVLRSMYKIDKKINNGRDFNLIFLKVKTMMLDFVYNEIVSMFKNKKVYDIHAFAEYIYTYSIFYDYFTIEEKSKIENIIEKSFKLFESKKDKRRYIYKKDSFFSVDEYMPLWGQSAMMNAISNLIIKKS
ncbi:D-glucuronyl C5-epimerase family protein [Aliarcobacter trophiarum]|uniref:D-glucuronyl C5-epimerase family protein n=1 Tax=Aliarcobacter trophiarum TaxID=708186 RepID=UPI00100ADFB5|nr:D-glucuronyl C5-epimerase family protein [Aliarcobacter trophiarum]RXI25323.1 hypothetical protein CRU89_08115 [Aliarcobacter trophiarum]